MKKAIALFCFTLLVLASTNASAANIIVDISQATFEITGPTSFMIRNVNAQAPELGITEGQYWGAFQWDTAMHILTPVNFGPEQAGPPQNINVTGVYSGYYYVTYPGYQPYKVNVTASLVQSGGNFSGTWYANVGEYGTMTGTVSGASATLNFAAVNCLDNGSSSGSYYMGTLSFSGTGFIKNCGAYGAYTVEGILTKQ